MYLRNLQMISARINPWVIGNVYIKYKKFDNFGLDTTVQTVISNPTQPNPPPKKKTPENILNKSSARQGISSRNECVHAFFHEVL